VQTLDEKIEEITKLKTKTSELTNNLQNASEKIDTLMRDCKFKAEQLKEVDFRLSKA